MKNQYKGFVKKAKEHGFTETQAERMFHKAANDGLFKNQVQLQNYMGQSPRRQFSPEEEEMISSAQGKLIPKIFQNLGDSPTVRMFNPLTQAATTAVPGGLIGAGLGALTGKLVGEGGPDETKAGLMLGGLLGAGTGGLIGYKSRQAKNEDIKENLRHLPEGATLRDYNADPLIQKQIDDDIKMRYIAAMRMQNGSR